MSSEVLKRIVYILHASSFAKIGVLPLLSRLSRTLQRTAAASSVATSSIQKYTSNQIVTLVILILFRLVFNSNCYLNSKLIDEWGFCSLTFWYDFLDRCCRCWDCRDCSRRMDRIHCHYSYRYFRVEEAAIGKRSAEDSPSLVIHSARARMELQDFQENCELRTCNVDSSCPNPDCPSNTSWLVIFIYLFIYSLT